jgi:hypothetical protein
MGAARSGEKMYIGLSGINKNESMGKKKATGSYARKDKKVIM